ncbi:hypothetical protein F4801DRAFT_497296 [Xylaria longipes]|nr:hypothetical protein F4801DRAFT_497296 [Xylaria longipes]RYC61409.1 hypothetical protein CHU98_g4791 [Xylaria longipes]
MHKQIARAVLALTHLATRASTHILLPSQSCPPPSSPKSFSLREITYLRYEASQYTSPTPLNTTQLAFEITNTATEISTGCALQTVMAQGDWVNDSEYWYTCLERTLTVDDREYPVTTSARLDWDQWRLTVNQTWVCQESVTISQFSALTLAPTCTENRTSAQYIKECSAPDIVVDATSDESIAL